MRQKLIFFAIMSIEFDDSNKFTEIEQLSLLHEQIFGLTELKTKGADRYDIETFNIFNLNNNGSIFLKKFLLHVKKEFI